MEFTLFADRKVAMELSHTEIADLLSFFNDKPSSRAFYEYLSDHPSSQIRAEVAAKFSLQVSTFEKLARDKSIEVAQRVASNKKALQELDEEVLVEMIERDVSVALEIARYQMIHIPPFIKESIAERLGAHDDPLVREAMSYEGE